MRFVVLSLLAVPALLAAQTPTPDVSGYKVISLQEALEMAKKNSTQAIQAQNAIETAEIAVRSAKAQFLPSVSVSAGQSQSAGPRQGPDGNIIPYVARPWSFSTGMNTNLQLFDGGRRLYDLRARQSDVTSAEAAAVSAEYNIALQVKQQYANILAARESEAAARTQLEQAEQQIRAASARVRAGAAIISDSLRSVIQFQNAQLALLNAQNNLRNASAQLTRIIGSQTMVTANPADTAGATLVPVDSAMVMQLALQGPAVRQAESSVESARQALRSSRTTYMPALSMGFGYSGSGFDKYYGIGGGKLSYSRSLSLSASFNVFDRLGREATVDRAKISIYNAEAQLREAKLVAQQNVVQQLGALRTAEEQIRIQLLTVQAAEEDLRVQQQRYSLGSSTLLEVTSSQSALNSARAALIQARQTYRIARAQLEAVIGRDLGA